MATSITQFRKNIFAFANEALEGKDVSFTHKGKVLKLVPAEVAETAANASSEHWFDRITPMQVFNPDWVEPAVSYQEEMQQAWEKKWADRLDRLP